MWHPDNCIYHYHQHLSIITIIRLCRYQLAGKCSKSLFERQVGSDKTLAFMSLTHLWNPNSCAGPSVCWGYCCNPTDIGLCLPPVQLCLREMFLWQTPVCSFSVKKWNKNDMQRHMGMSCLSPWHKSPALGKKTIQPPDTSFEDVRTSFGWSLLQIWWQIQNLWWNMCKLCKTGKLWTDKNQGCVYFGCNLPLPQSAPSYSVLPKLSEGSKALNVKTVESYGIWDKDNNMMSHACLATTRVLSDSTTEITYIHGFKVISN